MKYICSATLKHLPAQPEDWLGFMVGVLQVNAEQIERIQKAVVLQGISKKISANTSTGNQNQ